ncbi:uncharacterized protein EV420DRAFT_1762828 [Desarmillaria tabescens]|uniref:Protein kinase domain-containing protein n=1 Tax=Armillaria tabescens TaxID=1929756 RepID=A0AA39TJ02_ARMTA|nr:uncharacterized protein EV420DRAFT_1762828 [Desarmillaria tabescens]KAK0460617.1 hypothetical protein EV420DRAFT_1762828 [Desarmillaria tabescens]
MDTPCPANIQEFLTFLPARPELRLNATSETEVYTALDIAPPEDRPIYCRLYPELIPKLRSFLGGLVHDQGVGGVSCRSMQRDLQRMRRMSFRTDSGAEVSLYGSLAISAVEPVVQTIAEVAGFTGCISVMYEPVCSQRGNFDIAVEQEWLDDGLVRRERVLVCSDEDKAYLVLLEKAEDLSRPLRLDVTKKQTGAKAMAVKLALHMVAAKAEYGFFFAGYIAIAAQLVRSPNPSRPGRILLLSPVFKLQSETLPYPNPLTQFQAKIPAEPFLAILVAMLCVNLLSTGHTVESPPDLLLEAMPDEDDESNSKEYTDVWEEAGQGSIPSLSLRVATNAMILQHPCLRSDDIHRIYADRDTLLDGQSILAARTKDSSLPPSQQSFMHLCRCAPRIPSIDVDAVTLVERVGANRWSSVWRCRVNDEEKLHIMKFVSEVHSNMVLRELYMYEVALKDCSLVPMCYGIFQRPVGGWFGFLLEDVGDNLEEIYGMSWGDVKRGVSAMQWKRLIDSVEKLHCLSVRHGDLEPRNVALTTEGFKFFDFGRSEMHCCQRDEWGVARSIRRVMKT